MIDAADRVIAHLRNPAPPAIELDTSDAGGPVPDDLRNLASQPVEPVGFDREAIAQAALDNLPDAAALMLLCRWLEARGESVDIARAIVEAIAPAEARRIATSIYRMLAEPDFYRSEQATVIDHAALPFSGI